MLWDREGRTRPAGLHRYYHSCHVVFFGIQDDCRNLKLGVAPRMSHTLLCAYFLQIVPAAFDVCWATHRYRTGFCPQQPSLWCTVCPRAQLAVRESTAKMCRFVLVAVVGSWYGSILGITTGYYCITLLYYCTVLYCLLYSWWPVIECVRSALLEGRGDQKSTLQIWTAPPEDCSRSIANQRPRISKLHETAINISSLTQPKICYD